MLMGAFFDNAILAQSTSVFDASYFNNGNMSPPIEIGKGFHINDVFKQTRACFTPESSGQEQLVSNEMGGKKTQVLLYYASNDREYTDFRTHGISGKISFLNLFAIGGERLKEYADNTISNEERIIFSANVDFGIYSFKNDPKLTSDADSLIKQGKQADFIRYYGTHYISGVRKGSSINVILTRKYDESNESERTNASMGMSTPLPYKAKGSLEINNGSWVQTQLASNEFIVSIEISGPSFDAANIKSQVENIMLGSAGEKVAAIIDLLNGTIGKINDPKEGLITQYYYTPFELYGLNGVYWDEKKQERLSKINEEVIRIYSVLSQLEDDPSESFESVIRKELYPIEIPDSMMSIIKNKYEEITPAMNSIRESANLCYKDLETIYNKCSDVYCPGDVSCCDETQLAKIRDMHLEEKLQQNIDQFSRNLIAAVEEIIKPECEKKGQGKVTIVNKSYNPYDLYQGEKYLTTIGGKDSISYMVNPGNYNFKAVQKSGYVMYPTVNLRTAKIEQPCEEQLLKIGFED